MSSQLPSIKVHANKAKNTCTAACTCGKWEAWAPYKERKTVEMNAELHHNKHRERGQ